MEENTAKKRISKKAAIIIIVATIAVALIAITGGIAGHTAYLNNQKALITNYNVDFSATTPQTLIYYYENGRQSVDLNKIVKVSNGANFSVIKIQDEDGRVTPSADNVIDVSEKSQRLAIAKVVSKSGKKSTDYRITVAPESAKGNVINYNVDGGSVDLDDVFFNYSGNYNIDLPKPVKTFTGASGNTFNFEFEGWYTTADYAEGTRISSISAGTSGEIELYAKFADKAVEKGKDGHYYCLFGEYPQTLVNDYSVLARIRESSAFQSAGNGDIFTYSGSKYAKYKPNNVPNLSENGFSTTMYYIFKVEPVEWRILDSSFNGFGGSFPQNVTLLSTKVLNCSAFADNAGTIQSYYEKVAATIKDIDGFIKYYFDSDTAYSKSTVKEKVDEMASSMFSSAESNAIVSRGFSKYKDIFGNTEKYNCSMWLLNYQEVLKTDYGFDDDYMANDNLRKAMVSDFGAANGAYRTSSRIHEGQGSWWLRGAGDYPDNGKDSPNGDIKIGYNFRAKRIGYVKYTGGVQTYTALNMSLRSGVRPAVWVKTSYLQSIA